MYQGTLAALKRLTDVGVNVTRDMDDLLTGRDSHPFFPGENQDANTTEVARLVSDIRGKLMQLRAHLDQTLDEEMSP